MEMWEGIIPGLPQPGTNYEPNSGVCRSLRTAIPGCVLGAKDYRVPVHDVIRVRRAVGALGGVRL